MKELSRTVSLNCDTCGNDQFQFDEENEFTNYTCTDCGKGYSKEYDAKEIEKIHQNDGVAKVESRVYQVSDNKYSLKILNSGKVIAYNINVNIPKKHNIMIVDDKLPYEYLNPGDNFNLHVIFHMQSERKFEIKTSWENENGECFECNQLNSI